MLFNIDSNTSEFQIDFSQISIKYDLVSYFAYYSSIFDFIFSISEHLSLNTLYAIISLEMF